MISKKYKKVINNFEYLLYWALSYFRFFISITECLSISAFVSLFDIPIRITSSAIGLKICAIAGIKKYKSIIKKKKKAHYKIVLLAKSKLNNTGVLISKALINSVISHNELVLINSVLKKIKDLINFSLFIKRSYWIALGKYRK